MSFTQRDDGSQPPMLRLDNYQIVFGIKKNRKPMLWWPDGMTTAEASEWLDSLYASCRNYLQEVSQPPPPREKPTPHYRPIQDRPLPDRIED